MKNQFIKILFLVLVTLKGFSQDTKGGVYITYSDYKQDKLSYEIDCKKEKRAIELHEFLNQSFITIKHKGEKIKLQKDSIYGILNCDAPLIRFQNKDHYTLAEKGPVWIFYKEVSTPQSKGIKLEKHYYFSKEGNGAIIELTINNIKQAFPDNHKLHDMIDVQFQSIDISDYDTYHKMFKINHVINSSNTGNISLK